MGKPDSNYTTFIFKSEALNKVNGVETSSLTYYFVVLKIYKMMYNKHQNDTYSKFDIVKSNNI